MVQTNADVLAILEARDILYMVGRHMDLDLSAELNLTERGREYIWRRYRNHPAVRMWRQWPVCLSYYGITMCNEWRSRGYNDSMLPMFMLAERALDDLGIRFSGRYPEWLGDPRFHQAHRSNLVRKFAAHYGPLFPGVAPNIPYRWPK